MIGILRKLLVAAVLAVLVLSLDGGTVRGFQQDPLVAIYAPGTSSCGAWLDARRSTGTNDVRLLQFESFVAGFASAYNTYVDGPLTTTSGSSERGRNVLHVDIYGQRAFLDKYCAEHPTELFQRSVAALLNHLDQDESR